MVDFGLNETYVEILRSQWQQDHLSVPEEWRNFFSGISSDLKPFTQAGNGASLSQEVKVVSPSGSSLKPGGNHQVLSGVAKKIAENMQESLSVPTATSVRDIPVKVLEENRDIINDYLADEAFHKCSFTHVIAFAIVRALGENPSLNHGYSFQDKTATKLFREDINLGLAIDVQGRDGQRSLLVPSIKSCQKMDFWAFFKAYNDIVARAKKGKLTAEDFADTTVTLTNPGGIGTVMSNPRLMVGQGAIIATGSIAYPAEYEAAAPETLRALGIGKIMTVTSTYDHRIIQGAESGRFLASLHHLLIGENRFYEDVFSALRIPHRPYRLTTDRALVFGQEAGMTEIDRAMRVGQLIAAYRTRGYLLANVDPLQLNSREHPELDLQHYGLTIWDLDRSFDTLGTCPQKTAPFRDILKQLRDAYCRRTGVEYMYINDPRQRHFVQEKVECQKTAFALEEKRQIFQKLTMAEELEHFLHKRFVGHKRFSVEGAESVIPMLDELLNCAASFDVTDVMIGMSHRGRLNVLANVVGKPYEAIFAEFQDIDPKTIQGSGDVKYHLGAKGVHRWVGIDKGTGHKEDREVRVELACNPSHLEAVDSVVQGIVRARQDVAGDRARQKIIPVLLHGDAAFAGQGIVYETLQMSGLQGYRTGGTVHIVVNNQIGYTTPPERGRTALHCSDIGRALSIPVFRVNGDDPESCIRAIRIAFEYRMLFASDVIIDMVCYRRYGHNEGDEPSFTQPILYAAIQKHPSVAKHYAELLLRRGDFSEKEMQDIHSKCHESLEAALSAVLEKGREAVQSGYELFAQEQKEKDQQVDTRVSLEMLKHIAEKTTYDPDVIEIHPRVKSQVLERRRKMILEGSIGIDFGQAEILAYGSLLMEGMPVRLSGQDCGRGTFAHRHAVLYDINDGRAYIPLNHLHKSRDEGEEEWQPSRFRVYDSHLSEEAVLGFEYGYSVAHPSSLVIWEAQFGDFFNGAQIQVDQFISSSEEKWGQKSRVSMFLPHGYDGQGPEHSSARIERFLQLCANDNMRVVNCSTPAQLFHVLRRQAKLPKKPLIVFSHKSLLRSEQAASHVDELCNGIFQPLIDDPRQTEKDLSQRLILCSGKLYWELDSFRSTEQNLQKFTRVVRLEQLYPFPEEEVQALLKKAHAKDIVWVQEEPRNNGAFTFIEPIFRKLGVNLRYIGRAAAASPATGSPKRHKKQQAAIIEAAFVPMDAELVDVELN